MDADLDENTSSWATDRAPRDPLPPLAGEQTADVVVIGGGFTGVSTAWHLIERFPEKRILLLEAGRMGHGASGRNGGMMLNWKSGLYDGDYPRVRRAYDATMEGMEIIRSMLERTGSEHLWRRQGSVDVLTDQRLAEEAAQVCEKLAEVGVPIEFLDREALRSRLDIEGAEGGEFDPNAGQLDGLGLIEAVLPVLLEAGVAVHEGTRVTRIREGRTIELEVPGGTVRTPAVVLATNAYTPNLGYFRGSIIPIHSHVVGTAPRRIEDWAELGWKSLYGFADDSGRVAYGSITPRGELVFGGGDNSTYSYLYGGRTAWSGDRGPNIAAVKRKLLQYLPRTSEAELAYEWSGPVAVTFSRTFTCGVMGAHRNVYYSVGYSGNGVTLANLAGKILRDVYSDDDARWRELPCYGHRPLPTPPEPLRWLGYQLYTRLTGRSPRKKL